MTQPLQLLWKTKISNTFQHEFKWCKQLNSRQFCQHFWHCVVAPPVNDYWQLSLPALLALVGWRCWLLIWAGYPYWHELYSTNSSWFVTSTRHHSTRQRHVWRVEPMKFACVELVEHHSSTRSARNLVCCVICIKLWYVSYSLIYWSTHLLNLFNLTEQIGSVYVRAQKQPNLYRRTL